jgi:predicted dehydrogenase
MVTMIKIGLVGLGFIGKAHLEAYEKIPNAQVVAICTSKGEDKVLEKFKGDVIFDYKKILHDDQIDVVDICVPTFLHEEYIVQAARAGKHIICEKPLTLSMDSANRIYSEVERCGVRLFVGHILRFWPEYVTIKNLVNNGKVNEAEIVHAKRLGQLPTWSNWFLYPGKSGGALYDLHIHDIDFVTYLFGEVETVYAAGSQNSFGAWNHIMTTLFFKNGTKAFVEASHRMPRGYPFTMMLRIQGKDCVLDFQMQGSENIENLNNSRFVLYEHDKVTPIEKVEFDPFQKELEHFIHCIQKDQEDHIVPKNDVLYTLKLLKAIEGSLQSGKLVEVS